MPKQVKVPKGREFQFQASRRFGQSTKYDWNNWLNEELILLEQSTGTKDENGTVIEVTEKRDYECSTEALTAKLRFAGRRRYKVVDISRYGAEGDRLKDSLIIKARPMTDLERLEEDDRRVIDKAKLKAARGKRVAAEANGLVAGSVSNDDLDDEDDEE